MRIAYNTERPHSSLGYLTPKQFARRMKRLGSFWQNRPLDAMYPVVFFDALHVKIRDNGVVSIKALYLALGFQADGLRVLSALVVAGPDGLTPALWPPSSTAPAIRCPSI